MFSSCSWVSPILQPSLVDLSLEGEGDMKESKKKLPNKFNFFPYLNLFLPFWSLFSNVAFITHEYHFGGKLKTSAFFSVNCGSGKVWSTAIWCCTINKLSSKPILEYSCLESHFITLLAKIWKFKWNRKNWLLVNIMMLT